MLIDDRSKIDSGLTTVQLDHIKDLFRDAKTSFNEVIDLSDAGLGVVPCSLHGPMMGDAAICDTETEFIYLKEISFGIRCVDRPARMTSKVTVVGDYDHSEKTVVLLYALGGPLPPRHPDDPDMTLNQLDISKAFWAEHAMTLPEIKAEDDAEEKEPDNVQNNA